MPLIGSDFTTEQQQALRAMADKVYPGLTDQQVLTWATAQGVDASLRAAFDLYMAKLRDEANDLLSQGNAVREALE